MDILAHILVKMLSVLATPACLGYLVLSDLLALVAAPLAFRVFHRARVAWLGAARVMGFALFGWAAWLLSHDAFGWSLGAARDRGVGFFGFLLGNGPGLVPFSRVALWGLLAFCAALSFWGWRRWWRDIAERVLADLKPLLIAEIVFIVAFCFCCVLRMHSHGIRDQEKFMDFAFLNACIYSRQMPPPDPWRYDLPINYYYGGYQHMAIPAKMLGTPPEVAYNLAVALGFGWAALLCFGLGWESTRRVRWALATVALVLLIGNADVIAQRVAYWSAGDGARRFSVDVWRASRVIHDGAPDGPRHATINEFPFFSYLHADLHPHMMAVPYVLLYLCFLLNLLRAGSAHGAFGRGRLRWARAGLMGLVLGLLAIVNGFDFIAFGFVTGLALLARAWLEGRRAQGEGPLNLLAGATGIGALALALCLGAWRILSSAYAPGPVLDARWLPPLAIVLAAATVGLFGWLVVAWVRRRRRAFAMLRAALWMALLLGVAATTQAPFFVNYRAPIRTDGAVRAGKADSAAQILDRYMRTRSPVGLSDFHSRGGEFLRYWGVFAGVALAWAMLLIARAGRSLPSGARWAPWAGALFAWVVLFQWPGTAATATLGLLVLVVVALWQCGAGRPSWRVAQVFLLASLVVVLGCEFFYLRDSYGHGLQRMNTLFKFYYPCWIMMGVATPALLVGLLRHRCIAAPLRWGALALLGIVALMCMEFPLGATLDRVRYWRGRGEVGLDGMAWMRREHPGDYRAVMWLRENVEPNEVVAEAVGGPYTYHARVSTHTPLRAVLGWPGHEGIWRGRHPGDLERAARAIFTSDDMKGARAILERYGVDYVYVGELERRESSTPQLRKFEGALERIYFDEEYDVRIYRVEERPTARRTSTQATVRQIAAPAAASPPSAGQGSPSKLAGR